jgi:hypothetical protein
LAIVRNRQPAQRKSRKGCHGGKDDMSNRVKQFYWVLMFLILLAAGATGCSKTGATTTVTAVTYISVINAAPYGPSIDLYLNDTLASPGGGIPPGQFSTQYGSVRPGNYDVQFRADGTSTLLYDIPASAFDTNNFYTLITYNSAPGGGSVKAIKIHDDFSSVMGGNAYYRFFNLSPDAPAVDLYFNGYLTQPKRTSADNVSNPTFNEFTSIPAALYNLQVMKAGTDTVLASANAISMGNGDVYTIFLGGRYQSSDSLGISILQASF